MLLCMFVSGHTIRINGNNNYSSMLNVSSCARFSSCGWVKFYRREGSYVYSSRLGDLMLISMHKDPSSFLKGIFRDKEVPFKYNRNFLQSAL